MSSDSDFIDEDLGDGAAETTHRVLIDTHERVGMLLEALPVGLLIHTGQGILYSNHEASTLLGLPAAQLVGRHILDFVDAADLDHLAHQLDLAFAEGGRCRSKEAVFQPPTGTTKIVRVISGFLPWEGNPVVQIVLQDVTELKRTESSLRRLTITDELTGSFNRRHLFYEASLYVDPGRPPSVSLSAVLLDIDHFKRINDTFGHAAGDAALIMLSQVGRSVLKAFAQSDAAIFCRIGGEEFVALLPGTALADAEIFAERLRLAIRTQSLTVGDDVLKMTVSIGVGQFQAEDLTFDGLLSRCDQALYAAKRIGRNCVISASARPKRAAA